ncbi:DNA-binding protein HRm [Ferriphaselus amnicola]|uniref:DNA-binding protein HRm n=1 Tax=Ferriphaselus amnicola TaxID=1188319 RepID=A0A2Z6GEU0_9PROT|nr:DNA-binding protein HRm [Ferriphaselus amnicola]
MKKQDLITQLAATSSIKQGTVETVLDYLGVVVQRALASGDEVTLPGIGKLHVERKEASKGRNPRTGESIDIPAKNVPKLSVAKALKDAVNA